MKKVLIIIMLAAVLFFPLASAFLAEENSPKFEMPGNSDVSDAPKVLQAAEYSALADSGLKVDVIWPLPGYYYITDFLELSVYTNKIANCTYNLYSSVNKMDGNGTLHFSYIYNLEDNMKGEPYEILFECTDSLNTRYNDTWFWINLTDVNKYFLRENIGEYDYSGAGLIWGGEDNGLLSVYDGFYEKNDIESRVKMFIFNDSSSVLKFINNNVMPEMGDNYSAIIINNSNIYLFLDGYDKYFVWNSNNYLISVGVFSLDNSSVDTPLEIINAYLRKYPSELRNGICGDGEVDFLNEDGFKEECDKNVIQRDCGNNIGQCKKGKETRICNSNCTWGKWENCTAVFPKPENCTDNIDNDCNGLKDFKDPGCLFFNLSYPLNNSIYSENEVLFNIVLGYGVDELGFSYVDYRGREKEASLCKECSFYNKSYTFNDGKYNLNISAIYNNTVIESKFVSFIVDSTPPKISKVSPKKNSFTNGSNFYIKYTEANLKEVLFAYNPAVVIKDCNKSGESIECYFSVNLKAYDKQEIGYYVKLTDIAKNTKESKPIKIKVDTTAPVLNNPGSFWKQGLGAYNKYIYFNLSIKEDNFDEITYSYTDSRGKIREITLCNRLRDNFCEKRKSFGSGKYNLIITVKDKAGNSIQKEISFTVV